MKKILLIIKREYFTRVRNKTFILSTILLPLFFIGFIAASTYFSIKSIEKHLPTNNTNRHELFFDLILFVSIRVIRGQKNKTFN